MKITGPIVVPVHVYYEREGRTHFAGIAGGPIAPPRIDAARWWVVPAGCQGKSISLGPSAIGALVEWIRRYRVPGLRIHSLVGSAPLMTDLPFLTELVIGANDARDIDGLGILDGLRRLHVYAADGAAISNMQRFADLEDLQVRIAQLDSLKGIAALKRLKRLQLPLLQAGQQLRTISSLACLEVLQLGGLTTSDWDELALLPNLRALTVGFSEDPGKGRELVRIERYHGPVFPSTFSRIGSCTSLHTVRWTEEVQEISSLKIEELSLDGRIGKRGFSFLRGCRHLTCLDLQRAVVSSEKLIPDWEALQNITQLSLPKNCSEAFLPQNPLPVLRLLQMASLPDFYLSTAIRISKHETLESLTIDKADGCNDESVVHLAKLPNVTVLSLRQCLKVTDRSLPHIVAMHGLRTLDLYRTGITENGIKSMSSLPHLESFLHSPGYVFPVSTPSMNLDLHSGYWDLRAEDLSIQLAKGLASMPFPPSLNVDGAADEVAFRALAHARFPGFSCSKKQPGRDVITSFTSLTELSIEEIDAMTLAGLSRLPLLSRLLLRQDAGCPYLPKLLLELKSLREVSLSGEGITDQALEALGHLQGVVSLTLNGCFTVSNLGMRFLGTFPELRTAAILGSKQLTDDGLRALASLPYLTALRLEGITVSGQGFSHWPMSPKLKQLNVRNIATFGDSALEALSYFNDLEELECHSVGISDEGIGTFLKMRTLKSVFISGCRSVSKLGIDKINKASSGRGEESFVITYIP